MYTKFYHSIKSLWSREGRRNFLVELSPGTNAGVSCDRCRIFAREMLTYVLGFKVTAMV